MISLLLLRHLFLQPILLVNAFIPWLILYPVKGSLRVINIFLLPLVCLIHQIRTIKLLKKRNDVMQFLSKLMLLKIKALGTLHRFLMELNLLAQSGFFVSSTTLTVLSNDTKHVLSPWEIIKKRALISPKRLLRWSRCKLFDSY